MVLELPSSLRTPIKCDLISFNKKGRRRLLDSSWAPKMHGSFPFRCPFDGCMQAVGAGRISDGFQLPPLVSTVIRKGPFVRGVPAACATRLSRQLDGYGRVAVVTEIMRHNIAKWRASASAR